MKVKLTETYPSTRVSLTIKSKVYRAIWNKMSGTPSMLTFFVLLWCHDVSNTLTKSSPRKDVQCGKPPFETYSQPNNNITVVLLKETPETISPFMDQRQDKSKTSKDSASREILRRECVCSTKDINSCTFMSPQKTSPPPPLRCYRRCKVVVCWHRTTSKSKKSLF